MTHPAGAARPKLRLVRDEYPLNTTHETRTLWLSEQIRKVNPTRQQPDFDVLWDLYLLCLERDEREKARREQ